MKICTLCKKELDESCFTRRVKSKDGLAYRCRDCHHRQFPGGAKSGMYQKWYRVQRLYGISIEEYDLILSKGCEICGSFDRLVLDHCHVTKNNRGCLCHRCNTTLGLMDDDVDKLEKAITYLRRHNGQS